MGEHYLEYAQRSQNPDDIYTDVAQLHNYWRKE